MKNIYKITFAIGAAALFLSATLFGLATPENIAQADGHPGLYIGDGSPGTQANSSSGIEVITFIEGDTVFKKTTFTGAGNFIPIPTILDGGMTFPGWLSLVDFDAGGNGNFANEPSPDTVAFWLPVVGLSDFTRDITLVPPASNISFFYSSSVPVALEAFDNLDNLIASTSGPATPLGTVGGDPTGAFDLWLLLDISLETNSISRVRLTGFENQTGIDDLTIGRKVSTVVTGPPRKVIFILGIDSEGIVVDSDENGLVDPGEERCEDPEKAPAWKLRNNLKNALKRVISDGVMADDDIIWLSYGVGEDDAYCPSSVADGTYRWPKYAKRDTCDGVATAAKELDRLIRKFPEAKFDIVAHSMGGLVAAYWATGGSDADDWLSDDLQFLKDKIHSIITLDSPLDGTKGTFGEGRAYNPLSICEKPDKSKISSPTFADCLVEGSGSWWDLTGCNPDVVKEIVKAIDPDIFSKSLNILTNRVNFVHVNSTNIGDRLPGYWRDDRPPCRGDFIIDLWGSNHGCMLIQAEQLDSVGRAIMTEVYDDSILDNTIPWNLDLQTTVLLETPLKAYPEGWIRGSALKTNNKDELTLEFTGVVGSRIRMLYSGKAKGKVQVDMDEEQPLPDSCRRYDYGHDGGLFGSALCEKILDVEQGTHTVRITYVPKCTLSVLNVCLNFATFFFDALEGLPPVSGQWVVQSPVAILVIDPEGRKVGFDPITGTIVNEIPGASYTGPDSEPQVLGIPTFLPGTYQMLIVGTGT